MRLLRDSAPSLMREILRDQPMSAAKAGFAWRVAAGPALARATTARWTDDGTLHIEAGDASWRREVRHARPLLLTRLRALLGDAAIRRVVIGEPRTRNHRTPEPGTSEPRNPGTPKH
jgi:hypothetical protein